MSDDKPLAVAPAKKEKARKGHPATPSGPPLPEEIRAGLEVAGYPVELRVFNRLKELEMHPIFGIRMRVDDTDVTKEIDIRGHRLTKGTSGILALLQVKRMPAGAFVGFLGEQPTVDWVRFQRSRCGGQPSYFLSPPLYNPHGSTMAGGDGLGPAFDRFAGHPTCLQWCAVRRGDKNRPITVDHHQPVWEDFETLVRAKMRAGFDTSSRYLRDEFMADHVQIHHWFPSLVLDAPLYTYDVQTQALTQVDRLVVSLSVDTFTGVVDEYVDVVTIAGLDSLIQDYIATATDLKERMTTGVEAVLLGVARDQREAMADQVTRAAVEESKRNNK